MWIIRYILIYTDLYTNDFLIAVKHRKYYAIYRAYTFQISLIMNGWQQLLLCSKAVSVVVPGGIYIESYSRDPLLSAAVHRRPYLHTVHWFSVWLGLMVECCSTAATRLDNEANGSPAPRQIALVKLRQPVTASAAAATHSSLRNGMTLSCMIWTKRIGR